MGGYLPGATYYATIHEHATIFCRVSYEESSVVHKIASL